jgi:prolyl-tRNA synthetase
MRYSKQFSKTLREAPKDEVSKNAKLLLKAGFIDKLMAGSYTLLPLGFRVKEKIEQIIREEMDATGASEMLMPLLHPKAIWNETGRWETAREIMYQFKKDDKEFVLSFTHEEIVMDLIRKHVTGPKDFPLKVYHFSTKFRHEPRAKSGILRGREFLMKDLYSAHLTEEDMYKYYWEVADAYLKIFKRIGLDAKIVEAAGGVFTKAHTHEFQVLCEQGEDTIYHCDTCDFAQNKEIFEGKAGDGCPKCKKGKVLEAKAIEVGNIFPLGTMYAEKMGVAIDSKPIWMASYGIGPTRLIGTLVEIYGDEKGLKWPKSVAPYQVHLLAINIQNEDVAREANVAYERLLIENIEVLFDDRIEASTGAKFNDADLLGIPVRLVVSPKTGDKIEWKERTSENAEILDLEEVVKRLKI